MFRSIDALMSIWALPAPTAGAGTYTVTLSANVPYQITADYFTGADQTNPYPSGDKVSGSITDGNLQSIPVTNVGANDAMVAGVAHNTSGDSNGWDIGTGTYINNTTTINLQSGYLLGGSPMQSAGFAAGTGAHTAYAGIRIQVPGAAPPNVTGLVSDTPRPIGGYGATWARKLGRRWVRDRYGILVPAYA